MEYNPSTTQCIVVVQGVEAHLDHYSANQLVSFHATTTIYPVVDCILPLTLGVAMRRTNQATCICWALSHCPKTYLDKAQCNIKRHARWQLTWDEGGRN